MSGSFFQRLEISRVLPNTDKPLAEHSLTLSQILGAADEDRPALSCWICYAFALPHCKRSSGLQRFT
jgi:hypothetical protein